MNNSEINKKIREINSRKASVDQIKLHMDVQDFFEKLVNENGELETRDIREEVLTNLVKYSGEGTVKSLDVIPNFCFI